jgi:predicted TIM-barrel enzyme
MQNKPFLELFKKPKPVIGMLHLKGTNAQDRFDRFRREVDLYVENGVDGVIVETYFGPYSAMTQALTYLDANGLPIPYGVNCLNVDALGFHAASTWHASFVQLDSVIGHLKPRDEESEQAFLDWMRSAYSGCVLGGVRFKYQPVLSQNSVEEDLRIAMGRCDGICVTQDRTGQETSLDKIRQFRQAIGNFPLVVAAGTTPENIRRSFAFADAAIVGSYFKDTYKDDGELCAEHIRSLMQVVEEIRKEG